MQYGTATAHKVVDEQKKMKVLSRLGQCYIQDIHAFVLGSVQMRLVSKSQP
jgi:hypothetical protein